LTSQEWVMKFSTRIRQLRKNRNLTQQALAIKAGVDFTYISKIENGKLKFSDYPSANLISRLADALGDQSDELLLLAGKIPDRIRIRILERPDFFRRVSMVEDEVLDGILKSIDGREVNEIK
jgi:transcriptional regulator with XRE-family HTH domain